MVDGGSLMGLLEEQRKKFTDTRVAGAFRGWNKTMQYHFTDTGQYYLVRFVDGQPQAPVSQRVERPDIQYEMDTETFLAITRKEISGFQAYQQKRVRLKASMPDMLKLQKIDKL